MPLGNESSGLTCPINADRLMEDRAPAEGTDFEGFIILGLPERTPPSNDLAPSTKDAFGDQSDTAPNTAKTNSLHKQE